MRRRMTLQFDHRFCPFFVRDRVADAPAGHRVGFRETARDADEFSQFFGQNGRRENFRRRIDEKQITFVGQNINASFAQTSTIFRISSAGTTRPVGLFGELTIKSLVLSVIAALTCSAVKTKSVFSVSIKTLFAPVKADDFGKCHPVRFRNQTFVARD